MPGRAASAVRLTHVESRRGYRPSPSAVDHGVHLVNASRPGVVGTRVPVRPPHRQNLQAPTGEPTRPTRAGTHDASGHVTRLVTVEVNNGSRMVVQARRRGNETPNEEELTVLGRWTDAGGPSLSRWLLPEPPTDF